MVSIGIFDGVHKGHIKIIDRLLRISKKNQGESVIITFWPHPRLVLNNNIGELKFINTFEEKKEIIEDKGIDHLVVIPFTEEFSRLSSEKFVKDILIKKIGIKHFVIGYNHYFGRDRSGSYENLTKLGNEYNFMVEQIKPEIVEGENVSSTIIRDALFAGNIDLANKYLGYNYFFSGKIIPGNKIGRSFGFPTANIKVKDKNKLIPRDGVYAVSIRFQNELYNGMLNIGIRPTITNSSTGKSIEVHIFDFYKDIYSQEVAISFIKRIRDEIKFTNSEMLVKQLKQDKEIIEKIFSKTGN